jgi:S-adenosylmethionine decarboxylase
MEWFVDAHGCEPGRLRSREVLASVFERIVQELDLHPLGEALFHAFPLPGGLTGVLILQESHLSCHTFPERGYAAFDLYCCRPRTEWPWRERLQEALGAERVLIRSLERGAS